MYKSKPNVTSWWKNEVEVPKINETDTGKRFLPRGIQSYFTEA